MTAIHRLLYANKEATILAHDGSRMEGSEEDRKDLHVKRLLVRQQHFHPLHAFDSIARASLATIIFLS